MRRFALLVSTLMIISLVLAACGGEETSTTVPATDVPPMTAEVTTTVEGTATVGTDDLTTTPAVPVTGENSTSRLSNLLDFTVQNQDGDQVGDVEDMVLDMDNTQISYVIIGTGGFLDLGDKEVLIPWNSLQLQSDATGGDQNAFVLTVDSEILKNAPDVDVQSVLPVMGQPANDWDTDIRNFWESGGTTGGANSSSTETANTPAIGAGTESATAVPQMTATKSTGSDTGHGTGTAQKLQGVMLASELLGSTLTIGNNNTGSGTVMPTADTGLGTTSTATADAGLGTTASATPDLGSGSGTGTGNEGPTSATIDDVIVDPTTGDIQYLVLNSLFDDGDRWIPVPLSTLRWDETNQSFVFVANANALQNAPFFQEDQFPDTSTSGWDSEFSTFWQNNSSTDSGSGGVTIATATP